MFQGFNESTIMYYKAIHKENSKKVYQDNEQLYLEGVKFPLDELYFELYNYFNGHSAYYPIYILGFYSFHLHLDYRYSTHIYIHLKMHQKRNPMHFSYSFYFFPQGRGEHIQNLLLPRLVSFKFLF